MRRPAIFFVIKRTYIKCRHCHLFQFSFFRIYKWDWANICSLGRNLLNNLEIGQHTIRVLEPNILCFEQSKTVEVGVVSVLFSDKYYDRISGSHLRFFTKYFELRKSTTE